MKVVNAWRQQLGGSYWVWRVYHALVADAVALQRPTKFETVYKYLDGDLGQVADVGCGPGVFLPYLCSHADKVLAVDGDAAALGRVRARYRKNANLECLASLVNTLPFSDGQLDTVLFLEVLEHLTDDSGGLREIHRVLRPGGKLVLSVPVPPGEINEDDPWGHKREGYTSEQIALLLEANGFEILARSFAMFKFSRSAEKLMRGWRKFLKLPAPIFLSWVCYLDFFISSDVRRTGGGFPSCILIKARRNRKLAK
jgi:SAM-dependent methyltransferase